LFEFESRFGVRGWSRLPLKGKGRKPARGQLAKRKHKQLSKRPARKMSEAAAGPLHLIISIKKQQMTLYAGGQPVAHRSLDRRARASDTAGVFSILEKQIYHESNLYSSAPMPYMQRITWSAVGDAPGHRCRGVRLRTAAFGFRQHLPNACGDHQIGARVIIAQDDVSLTEFQAALLTASGLQRGRPKRCPRRWTFRGQAAGSPVPGRPTCSAVEAR